MEENMAINNFQGLQFPIQVQKGHFPGKDSGWLSLDLVLISGPIKEEQEVRACVITGCFYWHTVNDCGVGKGVQGISNPRKWNAE